MPGEAHAASWLTARRLRGHGIIVAFALWSIYLWTIATPGLRDRNGDLKGTDFLHFYALGLVAREHRGAALYDMRAQAGVASEHVPQAAGIYYLPLYPPQTSIPFALLAHLSYAKALAVWWAASALIYSLCCYGIWRACPSLRTYESTVAILALAFPAFFHLIAWGQSSAIALGCFTLAFLCLQRRREFLAGIALGCLAFKPQLAIASVIVLIASGLGEVLVVAMLSAGLQFLSGILYYGSQTFRDWLWMLGNWRAALPFLEPKAYQTYSLRTFWSMLLPWPRVALALYAISAVLVLLMTISLWRRSSVALSVRFSALLIASVLVAPHLTVYDLVVLAPAILLLSDELIGSREEMSKHLATALYGVYILPLLGPLTRWTHLQLAVIAMAAVLFLLWRSSSQYATA